MFAALTVPRLLEAVRSSSTPNLESKPSWRSPDDVLAHELPLAKACQKVLASMQAILAKTTERCNELMEKWDARAEKEGCGSGDDDQEDRQKRRHLALMNASEVKVVRHVKEMAHPPDLKRFKPREVEEAMVDKKVGEKEPGEFGVLSLGLGKEAEGALQIVTGTNGEGLGPGKEESRKSVDEGKKPHEQGVEAPKSEPSEHEKKLEEPKSEEDNAVEQTSEPVQDS